MSHYNKSKNKEKKSNNDIYSNGMNSIKKKYQGKNIYFKNLFVKNIDYIGRFICGLCGNICENPRYQYCGCESVFCKRCLDLYYDSNHHRYPKCKKETKELIPSSSFNESILNLNMRCTNVNCSWNGKLKDYKEHIINICPKEIINCPNFGCIIKLKREDMPNHIKKCLRTDCICSKCNIKIKSTEKNAHKNVCPKEKIECLIGCGEYIERDSMAQHEKNCPNSPIDCPYNYLGCNDKIKKKDIEKSLIRDTPKHLYLAIDKIKNMSEQINELNNKLNILDNDNNDLKKKVNELKEIIQKNNISEISSIKEDKIKESNSISLEIDMNSFSQSNQLLSRKRKLSLNNIENNSDNQSVNDFSSLKNNDVEDNKENEKFLDYNCTKNGENDSIYSLIKDTETKFIITDNIIEAVNLDKKRHYFVFYNSKYDIPRTSTNKYTFNIKLLRKIDWLGIGFCDKKMIEKNNYDYDIKKNSKRKNIGIYLINTNKVVWNSNNIKQCIRLDYKRLNKKNTNIKCTLSPSECELEFIINDELFYILNDVRCFLSDYFSPCLVFLKNTAIESHFNYI